MRKRTNKRRSWNRKRSVSASGYKHGNASIELVIIVAVLFTFAVAAIFIYSFFDDMVNDITADSDYSATAKAPVENLHSKYPSTFDTAFAIILIVLWIATIISATQIDTSPVFFGISILALLVALSVPPILGNAFEDTFSDASATGLTDTFPVMNYVMTHILQIAILIGGSVLVALYAKTKSEI